MLWCSIQTIRERKSRMVMEALCKGWGEPAKCIVGDPPDDGNPFAIYGQVWGAERLLPVAIRTGRPWWYIDNGFWRPGRGSQNGYYRICYRAMMPVYLESAPGDRARITGTQMAPWRRDGKHILFALPGFEYGVAMGLRIGEWITDTHRLLRQHTDRDVIVRDRSSSVPLHHQFRNCWALVTHSSNCAVEAAIAGVPVFVAPESSAAPVGCTDLAMLEAPAMPDNREQWWASLMCQQFMPKEMADGTAYGYLARVRERADRVSQ